MFCLMFNYLTIFFFFIWNTLDKLKPKRTSILSHLPVVSVIKALSFIPVELEKCN